MKTLEASIGVLLLAAGPGSRMGKIKQLLPWRGQSLLRHGVDHALASELGPVIVVLGAHFWRLRQELEGRSVNVVQNLHWEQGMGASIACGVAALEANHHELKGVVIFLGDQPRVDSAVLRRIALQALSSKKKIVASAYEGTLGVPAFFSCSFFELLKNLLPGKGAKEMFSRYPDEVGICDVPEAAQDIDTPDDFQKLLEQSIF